MSPQQEGGLAESHPPEPLLPIVLAPATGKERNTLRLGLLPVACWKINDLRFDFGSSFVLPAAKPEFEEFARLLQQHPGAPISLFGHADPTGSDEANLALSADRAEAVYAVFLRDVARWQKLASKWGRQAEAAMQKALGQEKPPAKDRSELYRAYMDFLCPVTLSPSDFLGKGGKGDHQGCSEFNPVRVLSTSELESYDDPDRHYLRDAAHAVNRRVVGLLFRPGTQPPGNKWPCGNGGDGCKKRFWSDGDVRRQSGAETREFPATLDTFACRFYHRLTISSPCEGIVRKRVRLLVDDPFLGLLEDLEVQVCYQSGATETVRTGAAGLTALFADQGEFADLTFTTELRSHRLRHFIVLEAASSRDGAWQRLVNLGYVPFEDPEATAPEDEILHAAVATFQSDHGLTVSGDLDSSTVDAIRQAHDDLGPIQAALESSTGQSHEHEDAEFTLEAHC